MLKVYQKRNLCCILMLFFSTWMLILGRFSASCQSAQQTMLSLRTSSLTAQTSFCMLPRGEHNVGLEGKDTAMPLLHCRAALQARLPANPSCLASQHNTPWSCATQQHDSIPCVQAAQGNIAEMHSAHCTQALVPQPKLPHTVPCNWAQK